MSCYLCESKKYITHPGGHKHWAFMNTEGLNEKYEQQLATLGLTDTIIVGVSHKE